SHDASRPGCVGLKNHEGLTPAFEDQPSGETALENLIGHGAMIDMAHMSEASIQGTLALAERLNCPVIDSHTDMRPDNYSAALPPRDQKYSERDIRASAARRVFALGGIVGLGTSPGHGRGEFEDPFRVYYNAGNPLIYLKEGHLQWQYDLRQQEAQKAF